DGEPAAECVDQFIEKPLEIPDVVYLRLGAPMRRPPGADEDRGEMRRLTGQLGRRVRGRKNRPDLEEPHAAHGPGEVVLDLPEQTVDESTPEPALGSGERVQECDVAC